MMKSSMNGEQSNDFEFPGYFVLGNIALNSKSAFVMNHFEKYGVRTQFLRTFQLCDVFA